MIWSFDQGPTVAAITTVGVLEQGLPLLNSRKLVLEGFHVAGSSALAFQSSHFVLSQVARFILCDCFHYSKVMAK